MNWNVLSQDSSGLKSACSTLQIEILGHVMPLG